MNLLKSPLRRTTAVLAGAFIGLVGAAAAAAPASAHAPVVTGTTTCADKDGNWTIDWSFGNDFGTPATVKKIKLDPKSLEVTGDIVEEGVELPANSAGKPEDQVHGTTKVEDDKVEAVTIFVWLKWPDGYETKWKEPAHYTVHKPEACGDETPTQPPAQTPEPTPIVEADCDSLTLGLDNPKDGEDVTLTFKTSKGETRELEVKAGEKKTTKFSASEGFFVEVGAKGVQETTKVEYKQPEGCESGGGGGEGSSLPETGAAAGSIAGGAAALLIAGVVLFFVARRRKVRFTA